MRPATSATSRFTIQPPLSKRHQETVEWLSAIVLWKRELTFLQKLLDHHRKSSPAFKLEIAHYQNIILYYNDELIDSVASLLRLHEKKLEKLIVDQNERSAAYFTEHEQIMNEADALGKQIRTYREEIYDLVEKIINATAVPN